MRNVKRKLSQPAKAKNATLAMRENEMALDLDHTEKMTPEEEAKLIEDGRHFVQCLVLFEVAGNFRAAIDQVHGAFADEAVSVGRCSRPAMCSALNVHKIHTQLREWLVETSAELNNLVFVARSRSDEWLENKQNELEEFQGRLHAGALILRS